MGQEVVIMTKRRQGQKEMIVGGKKVTGAEVRRGDPKAKKTTKREEKEAAIEVTLVEDQ